ncbi:MULTISPECIES: very short patch repair endonuclease [unclassified Rathayibacter]|uniref:very short patch repair endonuclease n=2 Tax=unclassified Rathayibacter TaxID=2609250 RepID=UPI000CE8556A|nr:MULTISPECIES: very short patch repair endonuclease [unclassified Rathayibacter]PPF46544.1 very short patch repair endonuclease [Rathayibacter sp. AY1A1]PPG43008.1 very short patch repair endonuclease [Rathayibacter sp. AY2B5]PPG86469.1 very short patch repair endonuclease [Rathayibacter sp. AY1H2]PPH02039.1 very short patch repair endonuclease [Rathayibacter sp. AY1G9]
MLGNKRRDTRPELEVRRRLHARGLRYRVDHAPLPGLRRRADVVFTARRIAVFIDGCFWHSCPEHATQPKRNDGYWTAKLQANTARDRDTDERLTGAGWQVLRYWEHQDPDEVAADVESEWRKAVLRGARLNPGGMP